DGAPATDTGCGGAGDASQEEDQALVALEQDGIGVEDPIAVEVKVIAVRRSPAGRRAPGGPEGHLGEEFPEVTDRALGQLLVGQVLRRVVRLLLADIVR